MASSVGRLVTRYTARGYPYEAWEPSMPRISDHTLECVIYLYRSTHEAMEGINIGGSGFLVAMPSDSLRVFSYFVYAVTNKHVIQGGASFIRLNTFEGQMDDQDYKPIN